jgi:hypothetical protein
MALADVATGVYQLLFAIRPDVPGRPSAGPIMPAAHA